MSPSVIETPTDRPGTPSSDGGSNSSSESRSTAVSAITNIFSSSPKSQKTRHGSRPNLRCVTRTDSVRCAEVVETAGRPETSAADALSMIDELAKDRARDSRAGHGRNAAQEAVETLFLFDQLQTQHETAEHTKSHCSSLRLDSCQILQEINDLTLDRAHSQRAGRMSSRNSIRDSSIALKLMSKLEAYHGTMQRQRSRLNLSIADRETSPVQGLQRRELRRAALDKFKAVQRPRSSNDHSPKSAANKSTPYEVASADGLPTPPDSPILVGANPDLSHRVSLIDAAAEALERHFGNAFYVDKADNDTSLSTLNTTLSAPYPPCSELVLPPASSPPTPPRATKRFELENYGPASRRSSASSGTTTLEHYEQFLANTQESTPGEAATCMPVARLSSSSSVYCDASDEVLSHEHVQLQHVSMSGNHPQQISGSVKDEHDNEASTLLTNDKSNDQASEPTALSETALTGDVVQDLPKTTSVLHKPGENFALLKTNPESQAIAQGLDEDPFERNSMTMNLTHFNKNLLAQHAQLQQQMALVIQSITQEASTFAKNYHISKLARQEAIIKDLTSQIAELRAENARARADAQAANANRARPQALLYGPPGSADSSPSSERVDSSFGLVPAPLQRSRSQARSRESSLSRNGMDSPDISLSTTICTSSYGSPLLKPVDPGNHKIRQLQEGHSSEEDDASFTWESDDTWDFNDESSDDEPLGASDGRNA